MNFEYFYNLFLRSPLKMKAFCKKHQIDFGRFRAQVAAKSRRENKKKKENTAKLIPVEANSHEPLESSQNVKSTKAHFRLPSGVEIVFDCLPSPCWLATLDRELQR